MYLNMLTDSYAEFSEFLPVNYDLVGLRKNAPYKYYMGEGEDCVIVNLDKKSIIYFQNLTSYTEINQYRYNLDVFIESKAELLKKEGGIFLVNLKQPEVVWNFTKNIPVGPFGSSPNFAKKSVIAQGKNGKICRINSTIGISHVLWGEEISKKLIKIEGLTTTRTFIEIIAEYYGVDISDVYEREFIAIPEKSPLPDSLTKEIKNIKYKIPKTALVEVKEARKIIPFSELCTKGVPKVSEDTEISLDWDLNTLLNVTVFGVKLTSQGYLIISCDSLPDSNILYSIINYENILIRTEIKEEK